MTDVDDWRDQGGDYEPDPSDYEDAKAYEEHCREVHGGEACDCPLPTREETEAAWAERARQHVAEDHGGGERHCQPPFLSLSRPRN
jgi:hypothetical protein